jgi:putative endonuclease
MYYVYIMASHKNGTTYIGMMNNLQRRVFEHREKVLDGYTKQNRVIRLVYYEEYADVRDAITREKRMKKWNRPWKIELVEKGNPEWRDLWFDLNK